MDFDRVDAALDSLVVAVVDAPRAADRTGCRLDREHDQMTVELAPASFGRRLGKSDGDEHSGVVSSRSSGSTSARTGGGRSRAAIFGINPSAVLPKRCKASVHFLLVFVGG